MPTNASNPVNSSSAMACARKSNLTSVIIEARESEHRTIENLAQMADLTPLQIEMLERGEGPVSTLIAVMNALPLRFTGIGAGFGLGEQLKSCREKKGLSLEVAALKTGLTATRIADLEKGLGDVSDLVGLLSYLAPKIARAGKERAFWSGVNKAQRDSRFTPPEFLAKISDTFGPIDLDPCGHELSPVVADSYFLFAEGDDGLTQPWSGRFVFVNPPYSALLKWLKRAHQQWQNGAAKTIACLVPLRMDSTFFHEHIIDNADIFILEGRLKFLDPDGGAQQTPFSLMLVVFGATQEQKRRFVASVRGFWMAKEILDRPASYSVCVVRPPEPFKTNCVAESSSLRLPAALLQQPQSDPAGIIQPLATKRLKRGGVSRLVERRQTAITPRHGTTTSYSCVAMNTSDRAIHCTYVRAA